MTPGADDEAPGPVEGARALGDDMPDRGRETPAPSDETPVPGEAGWSRLSARMLLIHPLRALRDLLPALIPLVFVGRSSDSVGNEVSSAGMATLVVLLVLVRWATTTYRVTDGRVQERHGLLKRELLTIPLDRVRSVDIMASPLHRVLGIATVRIGTGVAGGRPVLLDGLTAGQARALRHDLLERATREGADLVADDPTGTRQPDGPVSGEPEVLSRFRPAWIGYAPLSTSGLVTALAVWGFTSQLASQVLGDDQWDRIGRQADRMGLAASLVLLGVVGVLFVVACALAAYVLAYWGHTVTRPDPERLAVRRGLLTVRSTTLDLTRLRGVALGATLPMRLARGASLRAVTTGLGGHAADRGEGSGSGAALLPPAPRAAALDLAARLVGGRDLEAPLERHGRVARRRRWNRALMVGAAVLAAGLAGVWWGHWSPWWLVVFALPLVATPALAEDRYRGLGHAVVRRPDGSRRLVTRWGSLHRSTVLLDGDGVVGWTLRETFWQRLGGVATLHAATAAGAQRYRVTDLAAEGAWELAAQVTPEMLDLR